MLAGGAPLADEPDLFAGHRLHALVAVPLERPVGEADGGEAGLQGSLRSLPPGERAPLRFAEHVFGGDGQNVGHMPFALGGRAWRRGRRARPRAGRPSGDGECQPPRQARARSRPDAVAAHAVSWVGKDRPKPTPAAIRRSSSTRAISDLFRAERYSTGTPARSSRALSPPPAGTAAGRPSPGPRRAPASATPRFGNSQSCTGRMRIAARPRLECVPFFGNAVSSMTRKASAPPTSLSAWSASSLRASKPRPRCYPTRNGAAGRCRPARPARPSARCSCAGVACVRSTRAGLDRPGDRLATKPPDERRQPPPKPRLRRSPRPRVPNQSAKPDLGVVNKRLFCQSSARAPVAACRRRSVEGSGRSPSVARPSDYRGRP